MAHQAKIFFMGIYDKYQNSYWYVTFLVGVWSRSDISEFFGFASDEFVTREGWRTKSYAEEKKSDNLVEWVEREILFQATGPSRKDEEDLW